ncbi:MAG: protein kinase domain-containing protein [Acidobacteriota bacterium]
MAEDENIIRSGTRFGAYEIVGLLGAGGMGHVYRARDTMLGREVALKVLSDAFVSDPERLTRFEREAKTLALLNHPHIAQIYGFEDRGPTRALVIELVDGEDLVQRIARGAVPIHEALATARQIALALEAAHEQGIVHRDLKPSNVRIRSDGTVKVLDFGLAKTVAGASPVAASHAPTLTADVTRRGVVLGTAAYMSPEQARGHSIDRRTDIWAFGCVLYELLAGRAAFTGATTTDILAAVVGREPEWERLPASMPPPVRRLLGRCLTKDPRDRLHHIADARLDLDEATTPDRAFVEDRGGVAEGSARRWRTAAFVLAGVLVILGVIAASRLARGRGPVADARTAAAIATQLTDYGGTESGAALAPDGRSFVFVSDHGGTPDLWMRQVTSSEPIRLTADAGQESHPAFSPDGESVYFTRGDADGNEIWRIAAFGGQPRKVLDQARMPAPSPDGKYLAYLTTGDVSDLTVSALDGSSTRVLVRAVPGDPRPVWSPDGRWLSYPRWELFGPINLWLVDVESGDTRQVTRFTTSAQGISSHGWLPDSRHLVVAYDTVYEGSIAAWGSLGLLDTSDGSIARLAIRIGQNLEDLSLSSDGSRLLATFSRRRNEVWKVPNGSDPDTNGRMAVRLVDSTYGAGWTFVSRDGRTLLFSGHGRDLWASPLDRGGSPRQVTALSGRGATHSSLSPDGSAVAFIASGDGPSDLWVQKVDGSGLRQLTRDQGSESWPVWSPDGSWIAFSSTRDGSMGTWRISPGGGTPEKLFDGFFRGDLIRKPTGEGTWLVTSRDGPTGVRLLDVEKRSTVWEQPIAGQGYSCPVFSPDGRSINVLVQETGRRDTIWILDTATGASRIAARFQEPFDMDFRAGWIGDATAFIVNRRQDESHIMLFDRFWSER